MRGRPWQQSEIDFIKSNWGNLAIDVIADKLNRSKSSIKSRMTRINKALGKVRKRNPKKTKTIKDIKLIKNKIYEIKIREENPHFNMKRSGFIKKEMKFVGETDYLYIFETKHGYKECIGKNTPLKEVKILNKLI